MKIEFERIEVLEMLAMTLAHLHDAEQRHEVSIRMPILLSVRDKLVAALRDQA